MRYFRLAFLCIISLFVLTSCSLEEYTIGDVLEKDNSYLYNKGDTVELRWEDGKLYKVKPLGDIKGDVLDISKNIYLIDEYYYVLLDVSNENEVIAKIDTKGNELLYDKDINCLCYKDTNGYQSIVIDLNDVEVNGSLSTAGVIFLIILSVLFIIMVVSIGR